MYVRFLLFFYRDLRGKVDARTKEEDDDEDDDEDDYSRGERQRRGRRQTKEGGMLDRPACNAISAQ